jgi:hypothetical protein
MKARTKLQAKVGGINYTVLDGQEIPPALAAFYTANGAVDGMVKSGLIETEVQKIQSYEKKGKE